MLLPVLKALINADLKRTYLLFDIFREGEGGERQGLGRKPWLHNLQTDHLMFRQRSFHEASSRAQNLIAINPGVCFVLTPHQYPALPAKYHVNEGRKTLSTERN